MAETTVEAQQCGILRRLLAGGPSRKSRLHDERGQLVPLGRLLRNGPRALGTGIVRLLLDKRPDLPWISYDAQRVIAGFLMPDSKVLEFGSGMSTIWYARHAGHVWAFEHFKPWYDIVAAQIRQQGNVDYHLATTEEAYCQSSPDQDYDLIMIDGRWREVCARYALEHLAPGGMIYLDNSDKYIGDETGDVPLAQQILLDFAREKGLPVREFTDFAPTQLFVQRGLMVGGPI
jgi:hypothetical protein